MKRFVKFFFLLMLFLLLVTSIGSFFGYQYYTEGINKKMDNKKVEFTIASGEGITQIAADLEKAKVLADPLLFNLYLKSHALDKKIQAGSYLLPANVNILQLAALLQKGNFYSRIVIKEGLRTEEIANVINISLSLDNPDKRFQSQEFIFLAKNPTLFNYPFLIPPPKQLEGFLFADTYEVKKSISAREMLDLLLSNFNKKVFQPHINESFPSGFNFYQSMILSSILEREAKTDSDKKIIADVLFRRLNSGTPLGVDSTLQYVLGFSVKESTWWRQTIYQVDLALNNPYNTRLNAGLPPTPISNFSEATFQDALSPSPNLFVYYISDNQGKMHYAVTSAEQNANIAKYLRN